MNFPTEQGREAYELGVRLGAAGTVLIGKTGGALASALARCVGCGAALAGGEVLFHDGSCADCGAWLAGYYNIPATVFVRQTEDGAELLVTDGRGRALSPGPAEASASCAGTWDLLTGADSGWAAARAVPAFSEGGFL